MNRAPIALLLVLALAGCASPAATTETRAATQAESTPIPTPEPVTAVSLGDALKAAIPSITSVTEITEDNDPNDLIGRPSGYIGGALIVDSQASECVDTGVACGATIEDWGTAADAYARSDYIQGLLEASPMLGTEYNYIREGLLLRVSGELPPSAAAVYESVFMGE